MFLLLDVLGDRVDPSIREGTSRHLIEEASSSLLAILPASRRCHCRLLRLFRLCLDVTLVLSLGGDRSLLPLRLVSSGSALHLAQPRLSLRRAQRRAPLTPPPPLRRRSSSNLFRRGRSRVDTAPRLLPLPFPFVSRCNLLPPPGTPEGRTRASEARKIQQAQPPLKRSQPLSEQSELSPPQPSPPQPSSQPRSTSRSILCDLGCDLGGALWSVTSPHGGASLASVSFFAVVSGSGAASGSGGLARPAVPLEGFCAPSIASAVRCGVRRAMA